MNKPHGLSLLFLFVFLLAVSTVQAEQPSRDAGPPDLSPPSCTPGQTRTCGSAHPGCKLGKQICNAQKRWSACSVPPPKAQELCDGKDNDCDGEIDEGFRKFGLRCRVGLGECLRTSIYICSKDGTDVVCNTTPGKPSKEVCDGKDNDCNGEVDELPECQKTPPDAGPPEEKQDQAVASCASVQCPKGSFCVGGSCRKICRCVRCPKGQTCFDGKCVKNRCQSVDCDSDGQPSNKACNPLVGKCNLPQCKDIQCPSGMSCDRGRCVANRCAPAPDGGNKPGDAGTKPDNSNAFDFVLNQPDQGGGWNCSVGEMPTLPMMGILFFLWVFRRRRRN